MNNYILRGFRDELEKISVAGALGALAGKAARSAGGLLRAGWSGTKDMPTPGWAKALSLAGPALSLPGAVAQEDPSGQGRSRAERVTGLAASTVGSMALGGALSRGQSAIAGAFPRRAIPATATAPATTAPSRLGNALGTGAFIGGSLVAGLPVAQASEQIATSPFRAKRQIEQTMAERARRKAQFAEENPRNDEQWRQDPAYSRAAGMDNR